MQSDTMAGEEDEAFALSNNQINEKEKITMRSLITFTLALGFLAACGDKEEEDTAVEVEETEEDQTEETEDPSDTSSEEETEEEEA